MQFDVSGTLSPRPTLVPEEQWLTGGHQALLDGEEYLMRSHQTLFANKQRVTQTRGITGWAARKFLGNTSAFRWTTPGSPWELMGSSPEMRQTWHLITVQIILHCFWKVGAYLLTLRNGDAN